MCEELSQFDKLLPQVDDYLLDAGFITDTSLIDPPDRIREVEQYIAGAQPPFRQVLTSFIRETGLDDNSIYTRAFIDRRVFSKIRGPEDYHPGKNLVISLSFALRLDDKKTEALLAAAGYTLSRNSKADMIVRFFIERKVYDILLVNQMLYHFGEPTLS